MHIFVFCLKLKKKSTEEDSKTVSSEASCDPVVISPLSLIVLSNKEVNKKVEMNF